MSGARRTLADIAIIAALALGVAFIPGGGNAAQAAIAVLLIAFLAVLAYAVSSYAPKRKILAPRQMLGELTAISAANSTGVALSRRPAAFCDLLPHTGSNSPT